MKGIFKIICIESRVVRKFAVKQVKKKKKQKLKKRNDE